MSGVFFYDDALTSYNNLYGFSSRKLLFIFDHQSHARQLNILIRDFGFNTSRFGRLVPDWLVENMTHDVTECGMSLDVSVSPEKRYNRQLVLIRLTVNNIACK